jgi:hypothetical protein
MRMGDPGASVAIETSPVKLPVVGGAKITVKLRLSPGASVTGTSRPDPLKPLPVTFSLVIVMLPAPLSASATVSDVVLPT